VLDFRFPSKRCIAEATRKVEEKGIIFMTPRRKF